MSYFPSKNVLFPFQFWSHLKHVELDQSIDDYHKSSLPNSFITSLTTHLNSATIGISTFSSNISTFSSNISTFSSNISTFSSNSDSRWVHQTRNPFTLAVVQSDLSTSTQSLRAFAVPERLRYIQRWTFRHTSVRYMQVGEPSSSLRQLVTTVTKML